MPICSQEWHSVDHKKPTNGHILKKQCISPKQLLTGNSFSVLSQGPETIYTINAGIGLCWPKLAHVLCR